ncbi:hypothetical protein [Parafrankia elaeagni]|uniref:hypothetical protein n=1 Tax=Parafrankia elaeagni TaxID=222534 RepID=UPI00037059EE|nr:hypothetical protein [Parafrankia elaeagni]
MSPVVEGLRQWRHPREFRIARPALPAEWAEALRLASSATRTADASGPTSTTAPDATGATGATARALGQPVVAELATGLWRLRRRLSDLAGGTDRTKPAGPADTRRLQRQLDSLWGTLTAAGVEIQEHDRTRYDSGLDLQVLEFQQTAGLSGEIVLETLRPSVYLHGQRVQTGEVVVGIPAPPGTAPPDTASRETASRDTAPPDTAPPDTAARDGGG